VAGVLEELLLLLPLALAAQGVAAQVQRVLLMQLLERQILVEAVGVLGLMVPLEPEETAALA
jgi:hypothetical protein